MHHTKQSVDYSAKKNSKQPVPGYDTISFLTCVSKYSINSNTPKPIFFC